MNRRLFSGLRIFSHSTVAIALLFAVALIPKAFFGQSPNGTIVGVVVDPSGGVIVGATVTAVSAETGTTRTELTGSNGVYRIESVLPGTYKVTVAAPNFSSTDLQGLTVAASVVTPANITLKPGSASEQVLVEASNTGLNTDNGQLSGTISTKEISDLPISGLNPYSLALTLPGVTSVTQGGFSNGTTFTVGGGRPRANNFLIEGQDNNDAGILGQGLQPGNTEAVNEVTIIQNDYTAEYGHGAGSVSNLTYKSGTNNLHGSVFERLNNSSLDANDHYYNKNLIDKTKYRENLFGFTVGGPVVKDKLFFFAAYQWDKYRSSTAGSVLTVPSAAGIATLQQYASNPRVANLLEAYGSLVGDPAVLIAAGGQTTIALGADPVTGIDRGNVQIGGVSRSLPVTSESPELDTKGDWVINAKNTVNFRYIRTSYTTPIDAGNFPGQLPGFDSDQTGTSHNAGIVFTHIFSPTLINDFRASYGRIGFTFGLPGTTTSNPLFGLPGVSITGLTGYGINTALPQGRFHNTYQLQDSVSWTHGKHFVKAGLDLANIRVLDQIPFNFYGTISYGSVAGGYTALANYIDDFGGNGGSISQNFGSPTTRPSIYSQNYFVEDTYKPTPNASIDIGFRYEYNGAPFNSPGTPYAGIDYSNPACFPTAATSTTPAVVCNTKQQADGSGWGPRVGFSYSPKISDQHKTVIRSGFGVFYDVLFTNIIDNIQATAPNSSAPLVNSTTSAGPRGVGTWSTKFSALNPNPLPTNTAEPISDHLLTPRTMHWNLTVEQELPGKFSAKINYVGERGNHLYSTTEFNPYINNFDSLARLIPTRGRIVVRDNSGDSNYHGLWAELDRKFSKGFLFRAAYTYGKAIDDTSEIFTTNNQSTYASASYPAAKKDIDTGLSAYDHRQRLVLTYIYQPPVWHTEGGMKIVGNLVNRWSIAGITQFQTGTPENVEVGYDVNGDGIGNDRPILGNPKAPLQTYGWDSSWNGDAPGAYACEGGEFWDTSDPCNPVAVSSVHWIVPGPGTRPAATIGRNSLISKGIQQWDMNLQRSFKVWRETTFDFRGELFNVFNHGNETTGAGGVENTTLTSGIPFTAGGYGDATFAEPGPALGGNRHVRFFVRYVF
ncbi:hypothetical protein HDF16_001869 [Granulicella aggregans]|uniref:TonB-dependent transporter Oar-like beta-barrel domain-containing protein n=1 Tax=Granulicella aggregans TaxID=474949 RepID=A0A7W8E3G5_9BACT|nr:carboxypeptidase regulatory-like domain-containing protein [Granulicella aggregans]MBB5057184.1 hypothetical protein [Granulicella aggregans]